MHYLMHGIKRDGADSIRERERVRHLRYMIGQQDVVTYGGSFQASDGSWGGMMIVLELPDDPSAQAWLRNEPYSAAGLFASVSVRPFRQLMPEPTPGLLASELDEELATQRQQ